MKFMQYTLTICKEIGLLILSVIIILLTCLYVQCNIYDFKPPEKFSGNFLFNPYAEANGKWSKANFHAHSIAWNHFTNGHQTAEDIYEVYDKMGYDYLAVSNYHEVTDMSHHNIKNMVAYEHGFNISKTHRMIFEPTTVSFFDLPFYQSTSMKQSIIQSVGKGSSCVALNHPIIRDGYTDADLQVLSGYELMEVFNRSANSASKWDVALSAGKAVWCLGNDDMHDADKPGETGVRWTMINHTDDNITDAMKKGRTYIMSGENGVAKNALQSINIQNDTLIVVLANKADHIRFIGQDAMVLKTVNNTDSAAYVVSKEDTYVRTETETGTSLMYFNPIIRYDGITMPVNYNNASINLVKTYFYRLSIIAAALLLLGGIHRRLLLRLRQIAIKRLPGKKRGYTYQPK